MPRVAQGRRFRRREGAKAALRAILPDPRSELALILAHAFEARLITRRRHQLEPLGRRGRRSRDGLRPFAPCFHRLCRTCAATSSICTIAAAGAMHWQGALLPCPDDLWLLLLTLRLREPLTSSGVHTPS